MTFGTLLDETATLLIGKSILNVKPGKRRLTIVNGGQTGVDRAALDSAAVQGMVSKRALGRG